LVIFVNGRKGLRSAILFLFHVRAKLMLSASCYVTAPKGVVYDGTRGKPRPGSKSFDWFVTYMEHQSATFAWNTYTERWANELTYQWVRRFNYFYQIFKAQPDPRMVFTQAHWDGFVEDADFRAQVAALPVGRIENNVKARYRELLNVGPWHPLRM